MSRLLRAVCGLVLATGACKDDKPARDKGDELRDKAQHLIDKADRGRDEAKAERAMAERAAAEAQQTADEAREILAVLGAEAVKLDDELAAAERALQASTSKDEIAAAQKSIDRLKVEKDDLDKRLAEAKARAARAERLKGVTISKECQDNPLAKGCM